VQQLLPLQQQVQQQQQQIEELQQQQAEEIESDDDDDDDDDEDNPLVMGDAMERACREGDVETIVRLLDAGKNLNCVSGEDITPIMFALWHGQLNTAIMLAGRGADLSTVDGAGWTALHCSSHGGNRQCIEWVLANTTIDINSSNNEG
jgi:ankyrin repeat protein